MRKYMMNVDPEEHRDHLQQAPDHIAHPSAPHLIEDNTAEKHRGDAPFGTSRGSAHGMGESRPGWLLLSGRVHCVDVGDVDETTRVDRDVRHVRGSSLTHVVAPLGRVTCEVRVQDLLGLLPLRDCRVLVGSLVALSDERVELLVPYPV